MNKLIYILLLSFFLFSCIPEDSPVQPFERGDAVVSQVVMGNFYGKQLYFSLSNKGIVSENLIVDWDLAFACSEDEYLVRLNTSKFMSTFDLGEVEYDQVTEGAVEQISEDDWKYDTPTGNNDSTAFGIWWESDNGHPISKKHVYIVDRGSTEKGKAIGFSKFQIIDYSEDTYTVRFTNFKDGSTGEIEIKKDPTVNYIQLSFEENGKVLKLEPNKDQWDFLFSKHTELLFATDPSNPTDIDSVWYSVTSVLINPAGVQAGLIHSNMFDSLDIGSLDSVEFSSNRNIIGHDWKWFNLEAGSYTVYDTNVYIIKNIDGFYFKLRFIDFYDDTGTKGAPMFEYKLL